MRKYSEDYETVTTVDDNGNEKTSVEYRGQYFEINTNEEDLQSFKRNALLLVVVITALQVANGFFNNPGMYRFYVALPYVFAYLPIFYLALGILRAPSEKRRYRRDEIGHSFGRIKTWSQVLLILLGINALGEMIYLLFFSDGNMINLELLYLALTAAAVAASFVIIRMQKQIEALPLVDKNQPKIN